MAVGGVEMLMRWIEKRDPKELLESGMGQDDAAEIVVGNVREDDIPYLIGKLKRPAVEGHYGAE
uniref:Uncharacterized protein n=1 Tax=Moniliophthora roreri TaxID=221103 RepID=A0A0W0G855_MONRR